MFSDTAIKIFTKQTQIRKEIQNEFIYALLLAHAF